MIGAFVFRPAPVARKLRVRIEDGRLFVETAQTGRLRQALPLSGLTGGRWRETGMRIGRGVMVERWLRLEGPAGAVVLRQGGGRPDGAYDQNTEDYLRAAACILARAAHENPGLMLAAGPGPALAWSMTAIGAASAVIGLICAAAGVGAMLSGLWLDGALLAAAALAFGGGGASWLASHWPSRKIPMRRAADIAAEIEGRLA